jgi:DNA modification methylase
MQELLNKIICGDCIETLSKTDQPFADLIFADPSFYETCTLHKSMLNLGCRL